MPKHRITRARPVSARSGPAMHPSRMRLPHVAALPLAAIACSGGTAPPAAQPGPVTSLREIEGEWDIARFDGYVPTRLHDGIRRAFVDVRGDGLNYVIECNYSGNRARIDAGGTLHKVGTEPQIQTLMGCGPERQARDAAFFSLFATRPKVVRVAEGRLRLSDGRRELILERPALRRLANVPPLVEITGRWVPQSATRLSPAGGYTGWGFQNPGVLTIGTDRMRWSGCGGRSYTFVYSGQGQLAVTQAPPGRCGSDEPGSAMLAVLMAGPLVERTASGGIALTWGNEVISLTREGR